MRVAIVGAGIVGVTTAFELASAGHEVTVFERRGSVAAEASFANGGVAAPGCVTPWAAPGMPRQLLRGLWDKHSSVRLHMPLDTALARWMWRWWRASRTDTLGARLLSMQRLALFSAQRLRELTAKLKMDYERTEGFMVLLRGANELARAKPGLAHLADLGVRHELLDAAGCAAVEPGLHAGTPLHAAIHFPDGEVGNARQFAVLMRQEAQACGVQFRFHAEVERLVPGTRPQLVLCSVEGEESGPLAGSESTAPVCPLRDERVSETFDAVVLCAGLGSTRLLAPLGLQIPMASVYGYSITAPLREDDAHPGRAPRSGVMDERHGIAICRLGSRIRVAGCFELGGSPTRHDAAAIEILYRVLHDWFPGSARLDQAQPWKGARPMLPDGPPVLGASGLPGVWLNMGHGSSGWAMACGSARVMAELLASRPPPVDTEGLGVERLLH